MNLPNRPIGATLLPFLGVLRVAGPDTLAFLQGQLTNDVRQLADGRTQLAALNTPQGRVVALLRLRLVDGAVYALMPTELLEPVSALLRRFVLRSKVQLQVAAELQVGWAGTGVVSPTTGAGDHRSLAHATTAVPDQAAPRTVTFDYAPGRPVVAATAEAWRSITGSDPLPVHPGAQDQWLALDIAAGLPQVFAATSGAFVPQMLNLDLLEAISFSKGCYTGQEIVARTQHLGRIKRRLLRYGLPPGPVPAPLAGLFLDSTKVAEVAMSAALDDGVHVLAVTSLEARGSALRTEDGREAQPVELPYHPTEASRNPNTPQRTT
jgi:tRNA-modifying protein YgfZ